MENRYTKTPLFSRKKSGVLIILSNTLVIYLFICYNG